MEGKDDEFMFFNQSVVELVEAFPFYNSFTFQQDQDFENFFIFPQAENFNPFESFENPKNLTNGDSLLKKITKYEESYKSILQNNIMASPTASKKKYNLDVRDKISENFESNLILAEGTLPGLLISIMHKENSPVSENFLLEAIIPKYEDLRKTNGTKYSVTSS